MRKITKDIERKIIDYTSKIENGRMMLGYFAFLASKFSKNNKMMSLIDDIYYSDEEYYSALAKLSPYYKSRLIANAPFELRDKRLRALSVALDAYITRETAIRLNTRMLEVYKDLVNIVTNQPKDNFNIIHAYGDRFINKPENDIVEDYALLLNICRIYEVPLENEDDNFEVSKQFVLLDKFYLTPYSKTMNEQFENSDEAKIFFKKTKKKDLADLTDKRTLEALLEYGSEKENLCSEILEYAWLVSQMGNHPMDNYANIKFNRQEIDDMIRLVSLYITDNAPRIKDAELYYAIGFAMESLSAYYDDNLKYLEKKYSLKIKETASTENIRTELSSLKSRYDEQVKINQDKQDQLNVAQLELDKNKMIIDNLNARLKEAEDKNKILEQIIEDKNIINDDNIIQDKDIMPDLSVLKDKKIILFGGPPNWHSHVKNLIPDIECISIDNKSFDTSKISNADLIVIKTDYLKHAQWYKLVNAIRLCNKKVLYTSNNSVKSLTQRIVSELK